MKKLITLIVIVLTTITIASAGNGKGLNALIGKQLNVPELLRNKKLDEKVNVQFKLTTEGKAVVVSVNTSNPELKNYIITQFPKINFNKSTATEGMYFIDISFKVL